MLEIKNIKKSYTVGELTQHALNDVSVSFRKNEFVSVLGPSGSGKTTLLNIIGGLDSYDEGNLIINNVSTKNYKDRNWDTYRNDSIGFVFQSYNLIPHQSVLGNVELALTIGGVSEKERKKRAIEALEKVGLKDHINKKPNQLSGGQMQRVAIARALVNNPAILLADEPTGALDTQTSIQIMKLLKDVAQDRLVIMVTHNPELANQYSTRIVKVKDGVIVNDSNPYTIKSSKEVDVVKTKKSKMSWKTSMSLSFRNLATKKRRTLLTSFAGSIGIIGISLILSMSTGVNEYIADLQAETLDSYPLTISAESINIGLPGPSFSQEEESSNTDTNAVYSDYSSLENSASATSINNLTAFKEYIENPDSEINQYLTEDSVVYSYNTNFSIYSYDENNILVNSDSDPSELLDSSFSFDSSQMGPMSMLGGGMGSSSATNFSELLPGVGTTVSTAITDTYNILHGEWPSEYNEVVLFLDSNNSISAGTLYQLGLITESQYKEIASTIEDGEEADLMSWDYEEILNHSFYMLNASQRYVLNDNNTYSYLSDEYYETSNDLKDVSTELKIVGIATLNSEATESLISTPIGYTTLLTEHVISLSNESQITTDQLADHTTNVLTGLPFEAPTEEDKVEDAKEYISNSSIAEKADFYTYIMYMSSSNDGSTSISSQGTGMSLNGGQSDSALAAAMDQWLSSSPDDDILLLIYDDAIGNTSLEGNLDSFGYVDYASPDAINIYTNSFEAKDGVSLAIANYNSEATEENQIVYTDYVEVLTSSMTSIINVISYVLIAFVSVSLIVSCIMIGIITHISVMERTKEIGVLRALGASKRNISQVFNAETIIIGLCSGLIGVLFTVLLNIPVTSIVQILLDSADISVSLPIFAAVILIILSVVITVLGGIVPAKAAAKKDPVIALRTE